MATTALCTSFKSELLNGGHCFGGQVTPTASAASASASMTSVSSMAGVAVGMSITNANIPANTVVARTTSSTALTLSAATTGAISGTACTITGDVFKLALVKSSPSYGSYDATFTNYGAGSGAASSSNLGTDEVTGTGYAAGGVALGNVSATTSGTTAMLSFSPDPSWSGASFSTVAAVLYNSSSRLGGVAGRAVSVHDLGGTQTVSSGTLTLVMPAVTSSTAIIRLA